MSVKRKLLSLQRGKGGGYGWIAHRLWKGRFKVSDANDKGCVKFVLGTTHRFLIEYITSSKNYVNVR